MKRYRGVLVLLLSLLFLHAVPTFPQAGFATLSGRVMDPSGLAIIGAKIQVVNVDTNVAYPTETNESGLYSLPSLRPGKYRIEVEKEGFQRVVRPDVELHVADTVSIDFSLQVGAVAQTVTVEGGAPQVNTTSSSLGGLVQAQEVANLPLNGRNYINLTLMQPGISPDVNQQKNGLYTGTYYSSNGAPTRSNNFMLDGAIMQDQDNGSTANYAGRTLGIDGIQEYRVITNSVPAEYGLVMGSQTVMVSKGGTNQFHGSAFEYLRNSAMDAADFFYVPNVANGEKRLPPYKRNNFGASFGGPIRKDKTFFFATYEGVRERVGITNIEIVPDANCHGAAGTVVWNGQGTQPTGSVGPCPQLGTPNVTGFSTLPGATSNSVTIASSVAPTLALYPLPSPSLTKDQETVPYTQPDADNFGQIRLDEIFSNKDSMFGRYTIDNDYIVISLPYSQYFSAPKYTRHQYVTLSENHIFSTALLNTSRLSFSRTTEERTSPIQFNQPQYNMVPNAGFGQLSVGSLTLFGPAPSYAVDNRQNIFTLSDDITYIHGTHSLKFGTLVNRYLQYMTNPTNAQGSATFAGVAAFLSGQPSSYTATAVGSKLDRTMQFYTIGVYAQDDWRLRSNFTINAGLRYEPAPNYGKEVYGASSTLINPLTDTSTTVGPLWGHNPTLHSFSPRLGFAWDVFGNGKTALRGGASILYSVADLGAYWAALIKSQPPFSSASSLSGTTAKPLTYSTPLNFSSATPSNSLWTTDYNFKQARLYTENLTVEQQLPFSIVLAVSYAGSRGLHLTRNYEGNPNVPTGFDANGLPLFQPVAPATNVRENKAFSTNTVLGSSGDSVYNALEVSVMKRMTKGLQFQSAYTFASSIDNAQSSSSDCTASAGQPSNPFVPRFDRSPSCFQARQTWVLNFVYTLPSPKIQERVLGALASGWGISGIYTAHTGFPFNPWETTERVQTGVMGGSANPPVDRPNWAPGRNPYNATHGTSPGCGSGTTAIAAGTPLGTSNLFYDPCAFQLQPVGSFGNVSRDSLIGPGFSGLDFAVKKDTKLRMLGEAGSLQFRAEFFNIFNHPNFSEPAGAVLAGALADAGPTSESPSTNAGVITSTVQSMRQVELALRLIW